MKFLEMNSLIKTNSLFSKLFDPNSLEIEAYSCKQTRDQKRHKIISKPLRFYISTLELSFPDYDFSGINYSSFVQISLKSLKNELSFLFFTLYKNKEDVEEFVSYLDSLLEQLVDSKKARFLIFERRIEEFRVFLIHDKKRKRIIIIKRKATTLA